MPLRCSTCGLTADEAGFLCQVGEHAYNPALKTLECKRCWAERVMERESLRAIQEDAEMDAEHLRKCSWCHARRGLMPKLLLGQTCAENKKAKEGEARKAVA